MWPAGTRRSAERHEGVATAAGRIALGPGREARKAGERFAILLRGRLAADARNRKQMPLEASTVSSNRGLGGMSESFHA